MSPANMRRTSPKGDLAIASLAKITPTSLNMSSPQSMINAINNRFIAMRIVVLLLAYNTKYKVRFFVTCVAFSLSHAVDGRLKTYDNE
ncbi:MAG: hypothetical protein RI947_1358 [Candidatus Parcubacteria bacterium]